ncbi:MAG: protein kinase [Candidatus Obscuribacterales bacterium]
MDETGALKAGSIFYQRYKILYCLGEGGMGRVYRATDLDLLRDVAIKVLSSWQVDERAIVRFQNEARTLSRLSHPNIARVYDFGVSESGAPFMVIELVDGRSLGDLLDAPGEIAFPVLIEIFAQVADALGSAHSHGILHRDVKPGNVIVRSEDDGSLSARVIDFGIAKSVREEQDEASLTRTGAVVGSPLYMSPEQTRGETLTARSDLYSFGCMLFRALAGRPPFCGSSALETMAMHRDQSPPELSSSAGWEIDEALRELVNDLLAKDPARRPDSFGSVALRLRSQLEGSRESQSQEDEAQPSFFLLASGKQSLLLPVAVAAVIAVVLLTVPLAVNLGRSTEKEKPLPRWNQKKLLADLVKPGFDGVKAGATKLIFDDIIRQVSDEDLRRAPASDKIEVVRLIDQDEITDGALPSLSRYPNMLELYLRGSRVKTLAGIEKLSRLELLDISKTAIDSNSLERLYHLDTLKYLRMHGTGVSRDDLIKLGSHLPALSELGVVDCPKIGPDDLLYLSERPELLKVTFDPDPYYILSKAADDAIVTNDFQKARSLAARDLAIINHRRNIDAGKKTYILRQLATAEQNLGKLDRARSYFEECRDLAVSANLRDMEMDARSALLLLEIQADRPDRLAREAPLVMERLDARPGFERERVLWNRTVASYYQRRNEMEKARPYLEKAVAQGPAVLARNDIDRDFGTAIAASRIADCYRYLDKPEEALVWTRRAEPGLSLFDRQSNSQVTDAVSAYLVAAHMEILGKDYDRALLLNQECEKLLDRYPVASGYRKTMLRQRTDIMKSFELR